MHCYRSVGMAACIVSDRLIFLDLLNDRYFCLEPVHDVVARARLVEATKGRKLGVGATTHPFLTSQEFSPVDVAAVTASALGTTLSSPSRFAVAAALSRDVQALIAVKVLPLHKIVDRVRRFRRPPGQNRDPAPIILAAHLAAHRLLSAQDRCLPFSIALARHLRHDGYDVDLVIGVKVDPFAAHAWVQHGDTVLNDEVENARSFHPILVA